MESYIFLIIYMTILLLFVCYNHVVLLISLLILDIIVYTFY